MSDLSQKKASTTYCVKIEHDADPDMSWLEQSMYQPGSADFEHTYRSEAHMEAGIPLDPDWYRDPDNHVTLQITAFGEDDEGGIDCSNVIDVLCGIDFLADSDEYVTGTFYRVSEIPERCAYLRDLAQAMRLPA